MGFPWMCLLLVILPNIGGWIGGIAIGENTDWYKSLRKASIAPPGWIFGPVWSILYCTMGYASYLIWKEREAEKKVWVPLGVYALQLLLNWMWGWVFFAMHALLGSVINILLLDLAVITSILTFAIVRIGAGLLLIPYMAWLCLATYLNIYIYMNN